MKPQNFFTVMLAHLKVGTIGFGGGAALIPVLEKELVENKKWVDRDKFDVSVAIAGISPASLPVAICMIWNMRYSVLSAYSYALPGTLIYLMLLTGFTYIGEIGTKYLGFASVGFISFVLFLIYRFIGKNFNQGVKAGIKIQYSLIITASFLLTCGNAFGRLFYMLFDIQLFTPVFSINMLSLLLITIFVICFVGDSRSKFKQIIAFIFAGLFALANGRAGILGEILIPLSVIMILMVLVSIIRDVKTNTGKTKKIRQKISFKPLRNLCFFFIITLLLALLTFILSSDLAVWDFAYRALTSALTSFGGGEVYIGISEAVFVQTGFIPEYLYNSQIIGVANTMPGPVIVAMVAGIGFTYGNLSHGIGFGWLFGILGLSLTISATAIGTLILYMFFEFLKDSKRLQMVIKYIMPVVCGMLVSTALSLLRQVSSVLINLNINPFLSIGIIIGIVAAMFIIFKKYRINDLVLLLIATAGFVITLGIIDKPA